MAARPGESHSPGPSYHSGSLNGPARTHQPGWFAFESDALKKGTNQLRVTLRPPEAGEDSVEVEVGQVRVAIVYA